MGNSIKEISPVDRLGNFPPKNPDFQEGKRRHQAETSQEENGPKGIEEKTEPIFETPLVTGRYPTTEEEAVPPPGSLLNKKV